MVFYLYFCFSLGKRNDGFERVGIDFDGLKRWCVERFFFLFLRWWIYESILLTNRGVRGFGFLFGFVIK